MQQDRAGLPDDETVVLEDGDLVVRVPLEELRAMLLFRGEVDRVNLVGDAGVRGCHREQADPS